MSDIVDRLRALEADDGGNKSCPEVRPGEAADEIEQLRVKLAEAQKWREAWNAENHMRMGAEAKLAEAQQREAWWRELVARMQPNMQMSTTRYDELRALLLGLSAAPGGEE